MNYHSRVETASPVTLGSVFMALLIRELQQADFRRGFLETLGHLAPVDLTPAQAEAIWAGPGRGQMMTWVAELAGRVVGTVTLILEQKFIHAGGVIGHIEDVAVHPEAQGTGVGSQLVQHATNEGVRRGCYKVILNCRESVRPFYEKLGFRQHDFGMRFDARRE